MSTKQLHMFEGMSNTEARYVDSGLSDTDFAAWLTTNLNREYSTAQVRQYRATLNIPNNKVRPTPILAEAKELVQILFDLQPDTPVEGAIKKRAREFLEKVK